MTDYMYAVTVPNNSYTLCTECISPNFATTLVAGNHKDRNGYFIKE